MKERSLAPRERRRAQTLGEIMEIAAARLEADGLESLSLTAVAKELGVSTPALYRYFASRDDLVTALIAEGYARLAEAMEAADAAPHAGGGERVRALLGTLRSWALAHPRWYSLLFSVRPAGYQEPPRTIPDAHRSMVVLLRAFAAVGSSHGDSASPLHRQLAAWAATREGTPAAPADVLERGILAWTRLHGAISLEILGAFAAMGIDPALLYEAEVERLLPEGL